MQTLTLVNNNVDRGLKFEGRASSQVTSKNEQLNLHQKQGDVGSVYAWKVKGLTNAHDARVSNPKKTKSAYGVLALVVCAHVIAVLALLNAKATQPVIKNLQVPMMVSLVTSPAPEPEIVPLIPTPPQPVVKKQKPIIKKVQPTPTPVAVTQELAQPVVTEAPPTPATPVEVAKAPEVIEAPQPKPVAEPIVEPPRFGAAYLNNPAPDYPKMARRLGQEGRVLLKVLVAENGIAETVALATSSGFDKLDEAAIEAVKKWSFIPAKRSDQPISAYVLVPVKFSLKN
ncbi:MAG: energy transducer TonB [Methylotenera sp.]|uniref:energy transducer TonB n=1 Tax=Methylotenera sp. TaxID=2051956 RepID=UPI00248A6FEB|nr:energy transducer TonB [Methylotenera sp.]MDI1308670.1 energy transducer TonB [Methylotenera sp.]